MLRVGTALDSVAHRAQVRGASPAARKEKLAREKVELERMKVGAQKKKMKRLERMGECGTWISITPHKLNKTLLSKDEWLDNLRLIYGVKPLGLCSHCNGCGATFSVEHGLRCKKGDW